MVKLLSALRRGVLAVLAVAAMACGVAGSAPPAPATKGGGGEFRVLFPSEPKSLNPDLGRDEISDRIGANLFDQLVSLDADSRLLPDLATSWGVTDGGRTYTFHLRRDVRWHDGRPFTSADALWTLETLRRERPPMLREVVSWIAGVEAPDAATVVVHLREPWAPFLPMLASFGSYILPRHLYQGADWRTAPANRRPVGTGPFRFVEWVAGDHITLAANTAFDRPGPFLDRVVYRFEADATRVPSLLRSGAIHYTVTRPEPAELLRLRDAPRIAVETQPYPVRYYLGFNLRRPPFDDRRVRLAVNAAIHRLILVDRALLGHGAPALAFYTPAIPWAYNGAARVPAFDPGLALRLLDEAGLRAGADGVRLEAGLLAVNFPPFNELAWELQRQLAAVGVRLRLDLLPLGPSLIERLLRDHDFDLALMGGTHGPDPGNLQARFGSDGSTQFMGYESAELDAALAEGARTTDLAARAAAYFRVQEILARDLPVAPLAEGVRFTIRDRRVWGLPQAEARGLVAEGDYSLVRLAPPGGAGDRPTSR